MATTNSAIVAFKLTVAQFDTLREVIQRDSKRNENEQRAIYNGAKENGIPRPFRRDETDKLNVLAREAENIGAVCSALGITKPLADPTL